MRFQSLMITAAALFAAVPLSAQVAKEPGLTPGEVLAQVAGVGQVRSKPEIARFRLTVSGRGDTAAAARAACDATVRDLVAKLRGLGVPDAAITVLPPGTTQLGFIGNEAYADDDVPNPAAAAAMLAMARQRKTATTGVQVELTDMGRVAAVRQLLLDRDDVFAQPPALSLRDDTVQRRTAIAQAIAKARAEASAYAEALGLRVAHVIRVYNPAASAEQSAAWSQMIMLANGATSNEVLTEARVSMEVVLARR